MSRPASIPSRRWNLRPVTPPEIRHSLSQLPPVLLQVLYNRGLTTPALVQSFLEGHYTESTDPFRLPDMEKAVARIQQALENDETIIVYGDFDADGVTSTVLLVEALRGLGASRRQAQPYIPDRIDEGYGLNKEALTFLRQERNADLVITVDCGVRAVAEVEHANEVGLDVIITDHHSIGRQLPPALAVINPKREESTYPERMLAGVGIAFKLAQALRHALPQRARFEEEDLLDLVALGTVADLAPLLGENRQLVLHGLGVLNRGQRPGVAALSNVAGLKIGQLTAESIAFGLGPRINAAGRLDHAYTAAKLLAVNNLLQAQPLAQALNSLNKRRQQLTRSLSAHAETLIEPDSPLIFAADADFVPGVVGLVASRLAENYYRPAVVIEHGESESRGSCRSIPEFHITRALDQVADLLDHYGGHSQAAGLTVRNDRLTELQARLTEIAASQLEGRDLRPTLDIDVDLPLHQIDWALNDLLQQLEPTGMANPTPVFMSRDVQVFNFRTVGSDGSHLQLDLSDGESGIKAIAFRQGAWAAEMPRRIDIAYTVNVNEWRGRRSLQLIVQDLRASRVEETPHHMKILVTGAAGFIGSNLAAKLARRGDTVMGLDNFNDYYDPAKKRANEQRLNSFDNFRMVEADVRDRARMQALFEAEGFDAVAHLAALAGVRNAVQYPELYVEVDYNGTQNLMDAARGTGVGNFVFASTSSVYGATRQIPFEESDPCDRPLQPYAAAKRAAEILGFTYHYLFSLNFTVIRFFTVYGPNGRPDMMAYLLADSITKGKQIPLYENGEMYRDWTFVEDITDGVTLALDKPLGYEIINIGRGEPVKLADFVTLLEEMAGGSANLVPKPKLAADVVRTYADISKARRLLGYDPQVSVEEGVRQFWEWYKLHG